MKSAKRDNDQYKNEIFQEKVAKKKNIVQEAEFIQRSKLLLKIEADEAEPRYRSQLYMNNHDRCSPCGWLGLGGTLTVSVPSQRL